MTACLCRDTGSILELKIRQITSCLLQDSRSSLELRIGQNDVISFLGYRVYSEALNRSISRHATQRF